MTKHFHTKTFKSGNSVAVRLPKGFAIPEGVEVELSLKDETVTLRLHRDEEKERQRLLDGLAALDALPRPPFVEKREPIEFPDRPGL